MVKIEVASILESLKSENIASLAKKIDGISEKKLRAALKNAGYEFSNTGKKGWYYVGQGEEPLQRSIFDFVISTNVKKKTPKVNKSSHSLHTQFTQDEVKEIKDMLSWFGSRISVKDSLYDRIRNLARLDKARKTIVIDREVGRRLDDFAKRSMFDKSDILHLALLDFLEKYGD